MIIDALRGPPEEAALEETGLKPVNKKGRGNKYLRTCSVQNKGVEKKIC